MIDETIFRAYDIRGIYPDQIDEEIAYKIAQGYADFLEPAGPIVVGRDVRLHSEELKKAVISGLTDAGVTVIDIGLVSTELVYFAVGNFNFSGGIQVTASHNPKEWHGLKLIRENVIPVAGSSGLEEIKKFVLSGNKINSPTPGVVDKRDLSENYCKFLSSLFDFSKLAPVTLVYDPNFGVEGKELEKLTFLARLPATLISLNATPNGNFPKGRPDLMAPASREELCKKVVEYKAGFGVGWDTDADRVYFCAEDGTFVEPYFANTLLTSELIAGHPGEKVVYDTRYTWAIVDVVKRAGGVPIMEKSGRSFIEDRMRRENAIFGSEGSGHTYYRTFWYVESGLIALLTMWQLMSKSSLPLSALVAPLLQKYFISGEINFQTSRQQEVIDELAKKYATGHPDFLDGVSVEYSDWRANLRPSHTENLLRLNVEAKSQNLASEKTSELSDFIKKSRLAQSCNLPANSATIGEHVIEP